MSSSLVSDDSVVLLTAAAALVCGQAVLVPDGRVGIVQNIRPVASGEIATVKVKGIAAITAGATLTAGAIIGVHITNQTVLAAGTAGATTAGTLLYDVTSGAVAQIDLNEIRGLHEIVTDPNGIDRTVGASTAAAGTTTADAGVLPAGTGTVYPTTAADDTVGVRVHATDKVTGRTLFIGNGVSNKILKVYAPTGGAINGAAADAAFSSVSGKGVVMICLSSAGNTWFAF